MIMPPTTEIVGTWKEILQQSNAFAGKRVKLTLLDDNSSLPDLPILDRASLLKLPGAERDRILAERAESMALEYGADSIIFAFVAFYGVFALSDIFALAWTGFILKTLYEVIATPLTYIVVAKIKQIEGVDVYDRGIQKC
jgi:Putative vitamin uptake transporter